MVKKVPKNDLMRSVLSAAQCLRAEGRISDEQLKFYEERCLVEDSKAVPQRRRGRAKKQPT
ncbi:MAG: hypothetical protein K6A65_08785 [Succinivibrionaceae bacterium]|nr:hypothetical protein [Succinivibrionaceae bacterium]